MKQKTIKSNIVLKGVGLHTGAEATIILKPAREHSGINFVRVDLPGQPVIKVEPESSSTDNAVSRCTSIRRGQAVVYTVEHILSVLCGLGISNLMVEIDNQEVPGLDGSGMEFLNAIKKVGVLEQEADQEIICIHQPIGVSHNGSCIYVVPHDKFEISYLLDYDHPLLRSQYFNVALDQMVYEKEIAPSRTFCLEEEAQLLVASGLGKGANYTNTLVVGDKGPVNNKLRFPDECARHKVLDFIGDLYLLGAPIRGHVFATKSGHQLNMQLLKKIAKNKHSLNEQTKREFLDFSDKKQFAIDEIMTILPHRYPFLLVDKVIELEHGKRAIGIKNVTINDNFFQGHFPSRPVMPGVLMVEAMAQTAGIVILTNEMHRGKVAFFLSADNVKFRKVVTPGDQLVMEVEVVKDKARTAQIRAVSKVNGEIVVEADMMFSFTDSSYLYGDRN